MYYGMGHFYCIVIKLCRQQTMIYTNDMFLIQLNLKQFRDEWIKMTSLIKKDIIKQLFDVISANNQRIKILLKFHHISNKS